MTPMELRRIFEDATEETMHEHLYRKAQASVERQSKLMGDRK